MRICINVRNEIAVAFPTHSPSNRRHFKPTSLGTAPLKITTSVALVIAGLSLTFSAQSANAQEFGQDYGKDFSKPYAVSSAETTSKPSFARRVVSEIEILRYRTALRLTAAQQKYWPAAASALRALARQEHVDEAAVRRYAPGLRPLIASLDDQQKQVAMGLAQQAGLAQYASLF